MPYAVGDLHGHLGQLDRVLALIEADGGGAEPVIFLGDHVDRGPDARGVLDRLIRGIDAGLPWHPILGNHDRMFLRFLQDGTVHDPRIRSGRSWLHPSMGGGATLASYGLQVPFVAEMDNDRGRTARTDLHRAARKAVPEAHRLFLDWLPTSHTTPDHIFVHAGICPGVSLVDQAEDDLLWIREPFLSDTRDHGVLVVHGHTPVDHARHYGNRVNLDAGAGYGKPVTTAWIEGCRAWALTDRGRVELTP